MNWLESVIQPYEVNEYYCNKCGCRFRTCKYDVEPLIKSFCYIKSRNIIYCPECGEKILESGEEFENE